LRKIKPAFELTRYSCLMASPTFRCPRSGEDVPRPFAADPAADADLFVSLPCPACGLSHLLNKSTGRLMGEEEDDD
jgi:hypothetical protein